mmetsp:Transcript_11317/g.43671  ORF Transcript_11317/g.43671 Transcript_11317/m.43671 type:complete len:589 (-) Transcript_11317:946-2712(-)
MAHSLAQARCATKAGDAAPASVSATKPSMPPSGQLARQPRNRAHFTAARSSLSAESATALAVAAIRSPSRDSATRTARARLSASGAAGTTAVEPFTIKSDDPPVPYATTGTPAAIASSGTSPKVSDSNRNEVNTMASSEAMASASCLPVSKPVMRNEWGGRNSCLRSTMFCSCQARLPFPMISISVGGSLGRSAAATPRTARATLFSEAILPTNPTRRGDARPRAVAFRSTGTGGIPTGRITAGIATLLCRVGTSQDPRSSGASPTNRPGSSPRMGRPDDTIADAVSRADGPLQPSTVLPARHTGTPSTAHRVAVRSRVRPDQDTSAVAAVSHMRRRSLSVCLVTEMASTTLARTPASEALTAKYAESCPASDVDTSTSHPASAVAAIACPRSSQPTYCSSQGWFCSHILSRLASRPMPGQRDAPSGRRILPGSPSARGETGWFMRHGRPWKFQVQRRRSALRKTASADPSGQFGPNADMSNSSIPGPKLLLWTLRCAVEPLTPNWDCHHSESSGPTSVAWRRKLSCTSLSGCIGPTHVRVARPQSATSAPASRNSSSAARSRKVAAITRAIGTTTPCSLAEPACWRA